MTPARWSVMSYGFVTTFFWCSGVFWALKTYTFETTTYIYPVIWKILGLGIAPQLVGK